MISQKKKKGWRLRQAIYFPVRLVRSCCEWRTTALLTKRISSCFYVPVCLLGIDPSRHFPRDPVSRHIWGDGIRWGTDNKAGPESQSNMQCHVMTGMDCLLYSVQLKPIGAWTLHGCNLILALQECFRGVKTTLWLDITNKYKLMFPWTERRLTLFAFVVLSEVSMNIGTTEAFYVWQQTSAVEKNPALTVKVNRIDYLTTSAIFCRKAPGSWRSCGWHRPFCNHRD